MVPFVMFVVTVIDFIVRQNAGHFKEKIMGFCVGKKLKVKIYNLLDG